MDALRALLASMPYTVLIPLALFLGLAPFYPKPHLVEKVQWLLAGELRRPLDVFDLCFHATPLVLLLAKWLLGR